VLDSSALQQDAWALESTRIAKVQLAQSQENTLRNEAFKRVALKKQCADVMLVSSSDDEFDSSACESARAAQAEGELLRSLGEPITRQSSEFRAAQLAQFELYERRVFNHDQCVNHDAHKAPNQLAAARC